VCRYPDLGPDLRRLWVGFITPRVRSILPCSIAGSFFVSFLLRTRPTGFCDLVRVALCVVLGRDRVRRSHPVGGWEEIGPIPSIVVFRTFYG